MKNGLKRALAALLALSLLAGFACAEADGNGIVTAVADCGILTDPVSDGDVLAEAKEGDSLEYLYEASEDEDGVLWYSVSSGDLTGWVSSECAEYAGDDI